MRQHTGALIKLSAAMLIFGSIGLFVRLVPLQSSMIAFARALIGVVFLALVLLGQKKRLSASSIKRNLLYLLLSGSAIGFNWILLFESYRFTSVAVSTLCYYMAPILVILLSPIFLKERLTLKKLICVLMAIIGMACISGVFRSGGIGPEDIRGILLGLGAAVLYASVILLNKQLKNIPALDRTIVQLTVSALVLLPYNAFTGTFSGVELSIPIVGLLLVIGIVHTGFAYYLYFGSMEHLSGQSIAIASYIDPVIAVICSVTLLAEPFTMLDGLGAVLILGAALLSELSFSGRKRI